MLTKLEVPKHGLNHIVMMKAYSVAVKSRSVFYRLASYGYSNIMITIYRNSND